MGDTLGLRMPDSADELWTTGAVEDLVGQDITVTFQSVSWSGRIRSAHRYEDEVLGPGVWIEVETGND